MIVYIILICFFSNKKLEKPKFYSLTPNFALFVTKRVHENILLLLLYELESVSITTYR